MDYKGSFVCQRQDKKPMGCTPTKFEINSNLMTIEQRNKLVKETWDEMCSINFEEIGIRFMIYLFKSSSQIKSLWIFATDLETEQEIRDNSQMRYHANKIVSTLNQLILHIDEKEKRIKILENLGRIHFSYDVQKAHFQFARSTMNQVLQSILKDKYTKDHRNAWNLFFQEVIDELCESVEVASKSERDQQN